MTCQCEGLPSKKKCSCDCSQKHGPVDLRMKWYLGAMFDYPPNQFLDENKKLIGFEVELVELIAERLHFKVEWVLMDFNRLLDAKSVNYIDGIASSMVPTPAREEIVSFSKIYLTTPLSLLRRTNVLDMPSLEALRGKVIGAQIGSIQLQSLQMIDEHLRQTGTGIEIFQRSTISDLVKELSENTNVDGVILVYPVAKTFESSFITIASLSFETPEFSGLVIDEEIALGLPKGSSLLPRVNAVIDELEADGTLEMLKDRWYN